MRWRYRKRKAKQLKASQCIYTTPETFGIIVRHMMNEDGRVKRNLSLDDDIAGHGSGTATMLCAGADPSCAFSLLATSYMCNS